MGSAVLGRLVGSGRVKQDSRWVWLVQVGTREGVNAWKDFCSCGTLWSMVRMNAKTPRDVHGAHQSVSVSSFYCYDETMLAKKKRKKEKKKKKKKKKKKNKKKRKKN